MVVIDEKQALPPPPPYVPPPPPPSSSSSSSTLRPPNRAFNQHSINPPPFPSQLARPKATLSNLPPHILLYIVHMTLPQTEDTWRQDSKIERQRKALYWMAMSLRLVCRSLYIACMHVLRSTYLPAYMALVRHPYTSDPFPLTVPAPTAYPCSHPHHNPLQLTTPLNSMQRETAVLDLFLSVKVREDVWADDTEFHLEREESFKDMFDLLQPRSRLEDLVRVYGEKAGVVAVEAPAAVGTASPVGASPFPLAIGGARPAASSPTCRTISASKPAHSHSPKPIPFSALAVSFSPRTVGLVLTSRSGRRTIVEVPRARRDEPLETAAKRLVRELGAWLQEQGR